MRKTIALLLAAAACGEVPPGGTGGGAGGGAGGGGAAPYTGPWIYTCSRTYYCIGVDPTFSSGGQWCSTSFSDANAKEDAACNSPGHCRCAPDCTQSQTKC